MMDEANVGELCNCSRCGAACRVTPGRDAKAKMLRKSAHPDGFCANCAVTEYLANSYPINMLLERSGPEVLRHPALRTPFAEIMESGHANMRIEEIDWDKVVDNWSLPLPQVKRGAMNPHEPGDVVRSHLARRSLFEEHDLRGIIRKSMRERGLPTLADRLSHIPDDEIVLDEDRSDDGGFLC